MRLVVALAAGLVALAGCSNVKSPQVQSCLQNAQQSVKITKGIVNGQGNITLVNPTSGCVIATCTENTACAESTAVTDALACFSNGK